MKSIIMLLVLTILSTVSEKINAQEIPNGDFESWLTCSCDPPYWITNNVYGDILPFEFIVIGVCSGPAYSGSYAIEGKVDSSTNLQQVLPPILASFDIPLDKKPISLKGYYKFIPVGGDLFDAKIVLYSDTELVGAGEFLQVLLRFAAGTQLRKQFLHYLSHFSHGFLPIWCKY